jgi:NAD(P)H-hydrate epimerase
VLTGIIGSFLAQGYLPTEAALLGAYLHGACGDKWLELGNKTMLASDIAALLPTLI